MDQNLGERTKSFALKIIELVERLPKSETTSLVGGQLLKCGTSIGANYRAAYRARSREEFIAKMGIVEEQSDQVVYWMELLIGAGFVTLEDVAPIVEEARELVSIAVSSIQTARW